VAYDSYLDEAMFGEWKSDGEKCTLVGLEEDDVISSLRMMTSFTTKTMR
jgi:hypothetical protein